MNFPLFFLFLVPFSACLWPVLLPVFGGCTLPACPSVSPDAPSGLGDTVPGTSASMVGTGAIRVGGGVCRVGTLGTIDRKMCRARGGSGTNYMGYVEMPRHENSLLLFVWE